MAKINEIIRVLRIKRGLSQSDLAKALGVSRSAIGNYELGLREPDIDTIEAMADYFDVSVADMMGREDVAITPPPTPHTREAMILSAGIDRMPEEERKRAIEVVKLVFSRYSKYFEEGNDSDDATGH